AVVMLRFEIRNDHRYDDGLKEAVDWFMGRSANQYSYLGINYDQLKTDSALYRHLHDELANADPPVLKPAATTTRSRTTRPVLAASASSGHSTVRRTAVVTTAPRETSLASDVGTVSTLSAIPKVSAEPKKATNSLSEAIVLMHSSAWRKIKITNVPTDTPGRYNYTEQDKAATNLQGSAMAIGKKQDNPRFWVELGRLTLINKFGRCLHCSGAAVYSLVLDPRFDNYIIAVQGNVSYDHHYVLLGTEGDIATGDGYVIDIWDANLNLTTPLSKAREYRYRNGEHKVFCMFLPEGRAELRKFALERPKPKG
ncbi:MAG TPA: hypothetical protein VG672_29540, partial [Bryobacteraceae bacterium]|nr:hypothetical protein [Bryobacteraceae bacterium]